MKVAILELSKKYRKPAIRMDYRYHEFFCRLSKDKRIIFLQEELNHKTFTVLTYVTDIWEKVIQISAMSEFKNFIEFEYSKLSKVPILPADDFEHFHFIPPPPDSEYYLTSGLPLEGTAQLPGLALNVRKNQREDPHIEIDFEHIFPITQRKSTIKSDEEIIANIPIGGLPDSEYSKENISPNYKRPTLPKRPPNVEPRLVVSMNKDFRRRRKRSALSYNSI
jgi:hypothetical protein